MHKIKSFAVVGGDLRQVHLAGLLASDGYTVFTAGFDRKVSLSSDVIRMKSAPEAVSKSDCTILPLPFSVDGETVNAPFACVPISIDEIWSAAAPGTLVTGGKLNPAAWAGAEKAGLVLADYYKREELEIFNTIPTAEGAVQIAMEELPITINGAKCLVTGFGRVAKTLCRDLDALGADVTACARKYSDLAWMKALGYGSINMDKLWANGGKFDVVFNTVPAVILDEKALGGLKKGCLVIDLASKPGGVDFETAGKLGVKTIWALSLPGKVAPKTAGAIIKNTVMNIISEEESRWE